MTFTKFFIDWQIFNLFLVFIQIEVKMMKIKSLFRRGQTQASSSKTPGLRGASSISSLDSKHKVAPVNPLKASKVGSRDKLDKLSAQKTNQNHEKNKHEKGKQSLT